MSVEAKYGVKSEHGHDAEERIRQALAAHGEDDILDWAAVRLALSLAELNRVLDAGVAPFFLERCMAEAARNSDRYDEFLRAQLVRHLNRQFPNGFAAADQAFRTAAAWAMWAGLLEPSHKDEAKEVFVAVVAALRQHPSWCPRHPDDPRLLGIFEGHSFAPSAGAHQLADVERRIEGIVAVDNRPFRHSRAVENLRQEAPGYGFIYSLYLVDGKVCNGGFVQFYGNTGGACTPLAVAGFQEIGRIALASVVEESLSSALKWHREFLAKSLHGTVASRSARATPRSLDELDEEYYKLVDDEGTDWLRVALIDLVVSRPELF